MSKPRTAALSQPVYTAVYGADDGRYLRRGAWLVLLALILFSHLWYAPIVILGGNLGQSEANLGGGDSVRQASFVFLFAIIFALVVWHRRYGSLLLALPPVFLPFLLWSWFSLMWAFEPAIALRRNIFTTLVVLTVAIVVRTMPARGVVNLVFSSFAAIIIADWAAVTAFPLAIHQAEENYGGLELEHGLAGTWRGLHQEKNQAGAFGALALIVFLHETIRKRLRITGTIMCLLAAVFLVFTQSKTSAGLVVPALLVGGMAHVCYHNPIIRRVFGVSMLLLGLLSILWLGQAGAALAEMLDDPAAFTGRSQIWRTLAVFASDHFWLGSGYGAFWDIGPLSPMLRYGSGWVARIYTAHSGYIDILIQTGLVGFALAALSLVAYPLFALFAKPMAEGVPRIMVASVVTFVALHNLLETSFYDRANPVWVVAVVFYCLAFKEDAASPRVRQSDQL